MLFAAIEKEVVLSLRRTAVVAVVEIVVVLHAHAEGLIETPAQRDKAVPIEFVVDLVVVACSNPEQAVDLSGNTIVAKVNGAGITIDDLRNETKFLIKQFHNLSAFF